MNKQTQVPLVGAFILVIFAIAVLIYNEQKSSEISDNATKNAALLTRDYSPTIGNKDAKVTIVEFFDPACGTCKAFHPLVKALMSANPGKVKLVMRYMPLHQGSDQVVQLLEAANMQNKFWETLDLAYKTQDSWVSQHQAQPDKFWSLLGGVDLDLTKVRENIQNSSIISRVQQDIQDVAN